MAHIEPSDGTIEPTITVPTTEPITESTPGSTVKPPTSTPTNIPTPTLIPPTPTPYGIVTAAYLNVRQGPGMDYPIVDGLQGGDEVSISGRDSDESWLKVQAPDKTSGWVAKRYIEPLVDVPDLPILTAPPIPFTLYELDVNRETDIESQSITREIGPYKEHWYTFSIGGREEDRHIAVVFMFKPNNPPVVGNVEFFLYDKNQVPVVPPGGDADLLPHIGTGARPARDRDGDLGTSELIWSGPLTLHAQYYLRFVNRSPITIEYCLMPKDEYKWRC